MSVGPTEPQKSTPPAKALGLSSSSATTSAPAHRAAGDDRLHLFGGLLAGGRLPVFLEEVLAQVLGFGVGLGQRPAGGAVGGLDDGVAPVEDGLGLLVERSVGAVGEGSLGVAVEVDNEGAAGVVEPGGGDVDAVGCAVDGADLDRSGGRGDDDGVGIGFGSGFIARRGRQGA